MVLITLIVNMHECFEVLWMCFLAYGACMVLKPKFGMSTTPIHIGYTSVFGSAVGIYTMI